MTFLPSSARLFAGRMLAKSTTPRCPSPTLLHRGLQHGSAGARGPSAPSRAKSTEANKTPYMLRENQPMQRYVERRTPHDSAAYLLPHLGPAMRLLDAGCGPGNITAGFKALHPGASVVGIDGDPAVVEYAQARYGAENDVQFLHANISSLPFDDSAFDVVHSHQVLQYLSDVPAALEELRRVLAPGGVLGVRVFSFRHMLSGPADSPLFRETFSRLVDAKGGNQDVGLVLPGLVRDAGFVNVEFAAGITNYLGEESRIFLDDAFQIFASGVSDQCVSFGIATQEQIDEINQYLVTVRDSENGFCAIPSVDILARKEK